MSEFNKLAHAVWQCKYHLIWCPKYRFKILKGTLQQSVEDMRLDKTGGLTEALRVAATGTPAEPGYHGRLHGLNFAWYYTSSAYGRGRRFHQS